MEKMNREDAMAIVHFVDRCLRKIRVMNNDCLFQ